MNEPVPLRNPIQFPRGGLPGRRDYEPTKVSGWVNAWQISHYTDVKILTVLRGLAGNEVIPPGGSVEEHGTERLTVPSGKNPPEGKRGNCAFLNRRLRSTHGFLSITKNGGTLIMKSGVACVGKKRLVSVQLTR